ncbi:MAG: 4Fe-4S dicluster domain-containing protein [Gammaproteobacteria bacterium]|nr:4Fe-4S dicluster domain-containing protein [Gammaproteobacteria bacterium]
MNVEQIKNALAPFGLRLRGVAIPTAHEITACKLGESAQAIALVGNIGSSFWSVFSQTTEFADGKPDPLDRWSARVARRLAPEFDATPVFPSQGPPYPPFQQWAKRAENLHQSPLGLMIHPEYGLWHAYRFALVLPEIIQAGQPAEESPCLSCVEKPCLNTCPVGAYSTAGYDVPACAKHLQTTPQAECFQHGCMARFSCPAGLQYRYVDAQSQFHLQAFFEARG